MPEPIDAGSVILLPVSQADSAALARGDFTVVAVGDGWPHGSFAARSPVRPSGRGPQAGGVCLAPLGTGNEPVRTTTKEAGSHDRRSERRYGQATRGH
jgi:hypothetical protein